MKETWPEALFNGCMYVCVCVFVCIEKYDVCVCVCVGVLFVEIGVGEGVLLYGVVCLSMRRVMCTSNRL